MIERAQREQRDRELGQVSLFGVTRRARRAGARRAPGVAGAPQRLARREGDARLLRHRPPAARARAAARAVHELPARPGARSIPSRRREVWVGGLLGGLRVQNTKKGDLMARATLEDLGGIDRHRVLPQDLREVLGAAPGRDAGADQGQRGGRAGSARAPRRRDRARSPTPGRSARAGSSVGRRPSDADGERLARAAPRARPGARAGAGLARAAARRAAPRRSSICRATRCA